MIKFEQVLKPGETATISGTSERFSAKSFVIDPECSDAFQIKMIRIDGENALATSSDIPAAVFAVSEKINFGACENADVIVTNTDTVARLFKAQLS